MYQINDPLLHASFISEIRLWLLETVFLLIRLGSKYASDFEFPESWYVASKFKS